MPDKSAGMYIHELYKRLESYLDEYVLVCSLAADKSQGSSPGDINALENYTRLEKDLMNKITLSSGVLRSIGHTEGRIPEYISKKLGAAESAASDLRRSLELGKTAVQKQLSGIRKNTSRRTSLRRGTDNTRRYLDIRL